MAALTGTVSTLNNGAARVGQAEDIHDVIYDISPTETPVMTAAKRLKATNTLHQWQVDSLSAAANNAQIEGDESTFSTLAAPTMRGNYCQISSKTVLVSRTVDVAKKYGRGSELGYLVKKESKALKRDIEVTLLGAQASSAGGAATARQSAGFRTMIANVRYASGTGTNTAGTQPGAASVGVWGAATDGTLATFIEADLKAALELAWQDGGNPEMVVSNSVQKQRASAFAGASAFEGFGVSQGRTVQGAVIAGIDLYVSDYGTHKWTLDRFCGQTAVLALDPEYMGIAWFDPIAIQDLAKTGDSMKKLIVGEWAPVLQNPDAHAQVKGSLAS
jgi:hypothetical protein